MEENYDLLNRLRDNILRNSCKINSIKLIEIKYNINRSNNLLVKTQSYTNLTQNDKAPVPPKIAMQICELTSDPEAVGRAIEEYKTKLAIDEKNLNNNE